MTPAVTDNVLWLHQSEDGIKTKCGQRVMKVLPTIQAARQLIISGTLDGKCMRCFK